MSGWETRRWEDERVSGDFSAPIRTIDVSGTPEAKEARGSPKAGEKSNEADGECILLDLAERKVHNKTGDGRLMEWMSDETLTNERKKYYRRR